MASALDDGDMRPQEAADVRRAIVASLLDEEGRRNRLSARELGELQVALNASLGFASLPCTALRPREAFSSDLSDCAGTGRIGAEGKGMLAAPSFSSTMFAPQLTSRRRLSVLEQPTLPKSPSDMSGDTSSVHASRIDNPFSAASRRASGTASADDDACSELTTQPGVSLASMSAAARADHMRRQQGLLAAQKSQARQRALDDLHSRSTAVAAASGKPTPPLTKAQQAGAGPAARVARPPSVSRRDAGPVGSIPGSGITTNAVKSPLVSAFLGLDAASRTAAAAAGAGAGITDHGGKKSTFE